MKIYLTDNLREEKIDLHVLSASLDLKDQRTTNLICEGITAPSAWLQFDWIKTSKQLNL